MGHWTPTGVEPKNYDDDDDDDDINWFSDFMIRPTRRIPDHGLIDWLSSSQCRPTLAQSFVHTRIHPIIH